MTPYSNQEFKTSSFREKAPHVWRFIPHQRLCKAGYSVEIQSASKPALTIGHLYIKSQDLAHICNLNNVLYTTYGDVNRSKAGRYINSYVNNIKLREHICGALWLDENFKWSVCCTRMSSVDSVVRAAMTGKLLSIGSGPTHSHNK